MPTQPQTVTIAQALASAASALLVADSAANIAAALPNVGLQARVASFTSTATAASPAVLTAPQMLTLSALGGFFHAAAGSLRLSGAATVTAAQLMALETLPGFMLGNGASVTLSDSTANIVALMAAHPADLGIVSALVVHLDGTSIGAYPATQLNGYALHGKALSFVPSPGHTVLNVAAAAHDLGSNAAALMQLAGRQALSFTLTNEGATMVAADAAGLSSLTGFHIGAHTLNVSDTAAQIAAHAGQIFGQGFAGITVASGTFSAPVGELLDPALHVLAGAHTVLAGSATVSATQIAALSVLPGFSVGNSVLSVVDSAAALLTLPAAAQAVAGSITLSGDAVVTGLQAATLYAEPGFSTGAHHLTIADSAANLLGLSAALQLSASGLALSGDQTVTAGQLTQLAALGIKFSDAGHILTVADTAANLAGLSAPALALAGAEQISAPAVVSVATAHVLAGLAGLSLASGASLTVQDNAANLVASGGTLPSVTGVVELVPGTVVTLSAAQAHALSAIAHFTAGGATITVADTVANLSANANAGWQSVAAATDVVDTAGNLVVSAGLPLLAGASLVSLSGNGQVSAAGAAALAGLAHFSVGSFGLTVSDTAANMSANAAAVIAVASAAVVIDSGPIAAAAAQTLSSISQAGLLTFLGGDQLLVQDSYAALTNPGNARGLALAARLGVLDTAANLVLAAAHNWGGVNPGYTLSQAGVITAAQANILAGLGNHFSTGGNALSVADNATAVAGAGAALASLGITATVADTAANLGAHEAGLVGLGAALTSVHVTDSVAVLAATAAGISGLAGKLSGPDLAVADNASDVAAVVAGLVTLGAHVVVTVTDSAADIGPFAAALAMLGNTLSVSLIDTVPVTAAVAAALAPIDTHLVAGTLIAVSDTAAALGANAAALALLGADLGAVTVTGSLSLSVTAAASLAPLAGHLGAVLVTATGTGADVTANLAALQMLHASGNLAPVVVSPTTVSDVLANSTALNALPDQITVSDSAAHVDASLSSLAGISGLQGIFLTDVGMPILSMNVVTLSQDAGVLAKIATPFSVAVVDTGSDIAADLAAGAGSAILGQIARVSSIVPVPIGVVTLTQSQLLYPGVDDGLGSAMSKLVGSLHVTGVDTAHLGQIFGLGVSPSEVFLADTGANIGADLALGQSSAILTNLTGIGGISVTDHAAIAMSAATALSAQVDDSAGSVVGLAQAGIVVSGASVAQLPALANLYVAPGAIAVADSAANLQADLASGNSQLVAELAAITGVSISDQGTITLTEGQLLAVHVDDGAGSVLSKVSGGSLAVTGVPASDLAQILGLGVVPGSISITDTSVHLVSNLSTLEADIGHISSITTTGPTLVLTAAEALSATVDDGPGSLIDKLAGHVFDVSGASVAQVTSLLALPDAPASIAVTDSAGNIVFDLTSANSVLASNVAVIGTLTPTHGILPLSVAEAEIILNVPSLDAVMAKLAPATTVTVSGASVADLAGLAQSGWPHVSVNVVDTASNLGQDLGMNQPSLVQNAAFLGSVSLSGDAVVSTQTATQFAALPQFSDGGHSLTVSGSAAEMVGLGAAAQAIASQIIVTDTNGNLGGEFDALQAIYHGNLVIHVIGGNAPPSVSAAQYSADRATIDAEDSPGQVNVWDGAGAFSAPLAAQMAADSSIGSVIVADTANNIAANMPNLQAALPKLVLEVLDPSISAAQVLAIFAFGSVAINGPQVSDDASQLAALAASGNASALSYVSGHGAVIGGSNIVTANEAVELEGLGGLNSGNGSLTVWDTAAHLSNSGYSAALANGIVGGIYLKAPPGGVTVSVATALTLFGLPAFHIANPDGSGNALSVSDSAAHLIANSVALGGDIGILSGIVINGSANLTVQGLQTLQSLNATPGFGVHLTVLDTPSAIANAGAAAAANPLLLEPGSWGLSADGTVSEAQAVTLGTLSPPGGFSPNGHVITINAGGGQVISLADALTLNTLAGSLAVTNGTLSVGGSVSDLSSLSPALLALLTPSVVDSFANILAVPTNSPLLQGEVRVTDTPTITVAQAQDFLTGAASVIPAHQLSFSGNITVSGTVGDIRGLESGLGWLHAGAVTQSFSVLAADSATDLVNAGNAAFLRANHIACTLLSSDTVSAATATGLAGLGNFTLGASQLTVADSVADLINPANAAGLALASSVVLTGAATVDAADAEALLQLANLHLTTPLSIVDSSADLLDGVLGPLITASGMAGHVSVGLAGPETLDADTAAALVATPGFHDTVNLSIADSSSYLLNSANLSAEQMAASVTLAGDESVSANTVLRLSEVPHFTPGSSHLVLAGNDFANAATLKAIADDGNAFQTGGHRVTLTQDALDLTPAEYTALQADGIVANGHALGVLPGAVTASDSGNFLTLSGLGVAGGTVHVYDTNGATVTISPEPQAGFTFTLFDGAPGQNFSLTETVGGVEGAPVIVLDASSLESAASLAGASFAGSGSIQVDPGKFVNLYQAGAVPVLTHAALVYDPVAHTISLDSPSGAPVTLITLGGSTHPGSLDLAEIMIKHHG